MNLEITWLFSTLFYFLSYSIVPGLLLSFLVLREIPLVERLGVSFPLGFLLFLVVTLLGYWGAFPLGFLHISLLIINAILLVSCLPRIRSALKTYKFKLSENEDFIIVFLVSCLGFTVALYSGWHARGDAAIHLQAIRNILASDVIQHPVYSLLGEPIIADHAFDVYYYLIALIIKYSGLEPSIVWHYLSSIMALFVPFTIFTFVQSITPDKRLAVISLMAFFTIAILTPLLMYGTVYDTLVYPNRVYLWLILPVALAFTFKYLEQGNKLYLFLGVLACFSQTFVHQSGLLFYGVIISGVILLSFSQVNQALNRKRLLTSLVLLITISAPFLWLKLEFNLEFIENASAIVWHKQYHFYYLNSSLFAFPYVHPYGQTAFLSLFFMLGWFVLNKKEKYKMFALVALSSILMPALIVYNPLIVPFVGEKISYVAIVRMLRIPMYFLIFGLAAYVLFIFFCRFFKLQEASMFRRFTLLSLFALSYVVYTDLSGKSADHHKLPVATFTKLFEKDSVVLSDPITSTDIIEFSDAKAVVLQFNGAIDLIDISQEKRDVMRLLSYERSMVNIIRTLEAYGVDYIVVNKKKYRPQFNFLQYKGRFNKVYSDDDYLVIEYLRET